MKAIVDKKIITILLIGVIIVVSLVEFNDRRKLYFKESNLIQLQMDMIGHKELKLNYEVLKATIFVFNNNDNIEKSINNLQNSVEKLKNNRYFKENFPVIYKNFIDNYMKTFKKKVKMIYRFQTLNSAIKNSNTYLVYSLTKLPYLYKNHKSELALKYIENLVKLISDTLLSKSSMRSFIDIKDIQKIKNIHFSNEELIRNNKIMVAHFENIYKNFPLYKKYLRDIIDEKSLESLGKINRIFFIKNLKKIEEINYIFYAIILLIMLYTIFIIVLIVKLNIDNLKLNVATKRLKESMRVDHLTRLSSRYRYEEEIKRLDNSVMFLVNIDKFKHINEYYGTDLGDIILKRVSSILKNITKEYSPRIYRLGADDFGIVIDKSLVGDYNILSNEIISWFENNKISVEKFSFRISVSIGISDERPFFEKADIALSEVKESIRLKYLKFNEQCKRLKIIEKNIEKTSILYNAIKEDRIIPVYQPIVDIKSGKIVKYEVLARVKFDDGRMESIFPYLQIAKDNKLYFDITKAILSKSILYLKDKDVDFNLNFSIEDINDNKIIALLDELNSRYNNILSRITFELLESEAIDDYNSINNFIKYVRSKGAKIAIDDFGSGYSNFEHILNLDIDYLKIDGSLIKNIAVDKNSEKIVSLMSNFVKDTDIQTVAEFVENKEILEKLIVLGINLAQGYYLSKPMEEI